MDWIKDRLEERYGKIEKDWSKSPLKTLIQTVLSQNTNDTNRDRAEEKLWKEFNDISQLAEARTEKIAEAIKSAGLQNQKAKTVKGILESLGQRGELSLEFIRPLDPETAWKELRSFAGVGKKTAAVVALFAFDKPIFPVDTHVRRTTTRLELVKGGEDHHRTLSRLVPDEDMYQLHLHLIKLGRETCKARDPHCQSCVLVGRCPTGLSEGLESR